MANFKSSFGRAGPRGGLRECALAARTVHHSNNTLLRACAFAKMRQLIMTEWLHKILFSCIGERERERERERESKGKKTFDVYWLIIG